MFAGLVVVALLVDLVLMRHGGPHKVTFKEATWWSLGWVALALAFNAGCGGTRDSNSATAEGNLRHRLPGREVAGGRQRLRVDDDLQLLRGAARAAAPRAAVRHRRRHRAAHDHDLRRQLADGEFHWLLYVFGAFLLVTGIKMAWFSEHDPDLEKNPLIRWIRNHYPVTEKLEGERFFVMRDGVRMMTPLFLALVLVEISDVIFAVDSIPAIFAITTDPFIVLTSNLFAILGLRAMYFLLADLGDRFELLKYGLARSWSSSAPRC
jgi:tellurite resistance protein TerC